MPPGPSRRPGPPARRSLRPAAGAATRRRLLDAAGEVFADRGFRAATLREIARRARSNLAAANYHYGSKERLYLEVARERFDALERRFAERGAPTVPEEDLSGRSREELEELLRARVRTMLASFLEEDPIHAALMQRELLDPSRALPVIVQRWVAPLRDALERVVAHLAPELSTEERARCTFSVVGQVAFYLTHRPALLLMMERRSWPRGFVDAIADHVTEFTLGGVDRLRARAAASGARRRSRA
jgi:AcrR family transcriptional regulator